MNEINLGEQKINLPSLLRKNDSIVFQRLNTGIGDIILCLPIFEELQKKYSINSFFDIKKNYFLLLEDNPYCSSFNQEQIDLKINLTNFFENNSSLKKHRLDFLAKALGLKLQKKKSILHNNKFILSSEIETLLPPKYGLVFINSNNYCRQIPHPLALKIQQKLSYVLNMDILFFYSECIMIDGKFLSTSLENLLALIKKSQICVGVDSGPMHIAGALNVPFVVISNVVDPQLRYKYYDNWENIVTFLNLDCLYECEHKCDFDFCPPCLQFLDLNDLIQKAEELLNGKS